MKETIVTAIAAAIGAVAAPHLPVDPILGTTLVAAVAGFFGFSLAKAA